MNFSSLFTIVFCVLISLVSVYPTTVLAGGYSIFKIHEHHNNTYVTENYYDGDLIQNITEEYYPESLTIEEYYVSKGVTENYLMDAFAASSAMAGLDFTNTTTKLQIGAAIGGFGDVKKLGVGVGKVLDSDVVGDLMWSFKVTERVNGHTPWVTGIIWKVP